MATIIEPDRLYTPEDLLTLPDDASYELVDGHLVEQSVSILSENVAARLAFRLGGVIERDSIGYLLSSGAMLQCFPGHPRRIRKPDLCFIRRERLSVSKLGEGFLTIPPDLAVEVVSPNDEAEDLEVKLLEYLGAGIPLLWVIYPVARSAMVHRLDGSAGRLREGDELLGEDVVPGFSCRLGDLFPPLPEPPAEPKPADA